MKLQDVIARLETTPQEEVYLIASAFEEIDRLREELAEAKALTQRARDECMAFAEEQEKRADSLEEARFADGERITMLEESERAVVQREAKLRAVLEAANSALNELDGWKPADPPSEGAVESGICAADALEGE